MAVKTYGTIIFDAENSKWVVAKAEPHICIRLKQIFPKIDKSSSVPFLFDNTNENCHDLLWFMERYPLYISSIDKSAMKGGSISYVNHINELERIMMPEYVPREIFFKDGRVARPYQRNGAELISAVKRMLLADDLGLGKTITTIQTIMYPDSLPAIIVVPSHMITHWKDKLSEFTNLKVHVIKGTKPYSLPEADVYISRYSCLYGWIDVSKTGFWKTAGFDEVQDLRHSGTNKYEGARALSDSVEKVIALSATPIYNYGNEIFTICNLIKPGCLGTYYEFTREWCPDGTKVSDPQALGTYLREKHIMLRRKRSEVNMELPPINKLLYTVGYDEKEVKKQEDRAYELAIQTTTGSFMERGEASRELSIFARKLTGVSKARDVAAFAKTIVDSGKPILLAGWHRDVYDIWLEELKEYHPVMYTGSESPAHKDRSVKEFREGKSKIFIISLRSGVGLDGLQDVCDTVIYGELDHSPKVHNQLSGRLDRDRQKNQVTEIFLTSNWGSDPVLIDRLALKAAQSHGILNPDSDILEQHSDDGWIKELAQSFINKKGIPQPETIESNG